MSTEISNTTTAQMSNINEFFNNEFGTIRTMVINDEPWFVGKDVAGALGYTNSRDALATHVDDCDKMMGSQNATPSITDRMGRAQRPTWINESGLYALIFGSKLESAKRFKHWVTSEVLPTLRKTGSYSLPEQKPDSYLIEDPAARARRWAEEYEEKALLEKENKQLKPKAEDWDRFLDTKGTFSALDIAHALDIGRSTFFAMLRDVKICFKNERDENIPYAKAVHKNKFTTCMVNKNGLPCTQMRVYPEGIPYITKKLKERGYIDGAKENYVLSYFKSLEKNSKANLAIA